MAVMKEYQSAEKMVWMKAVKKVAMTVDEMAVKTAELKDEQ